MTSTTSSTSTAPPRQRWAEIGAAGGTFAEGYGWILYSTFAALFAPVLFFSPADPLAATLGGLLTLGVAFLARPFGMVLFGHLADRYGRRPVLMGTVALMGAADLAIVLLPTYAQVGALAPVLLVAARFAQGIAYGGEWGPATLVAAEDASTRRGRAGATVAAALTAGSVLATAMLLLVTTTLTRDELLTWGWRAPFALGVVLAVVVLLVRRRVPETATFEAARKRGELVPHPIRTTWRRHPRTVALLIAACSGTGAAFYIALVLGQTWGIQIGYSRPQVTLLALALSIGMVALSLVGGRMADRFGARATVAVAAAATALFAPAWALLVGSGNIALAVIGSLVLGGTASAGFAAFGAYAGGFFGAPLRASGLSLSQQIGSVIGGGLVPVVAAALLAATGSIVPVVAILIALQIVALLALRRLGPAQEWTS
jgi:MFS family permease